VGRRLPTSTVRCHSTAELLTNDRFTSIQQLRSYVCVKYEQKEWERALCGRGAIRVRKLILLLCITCK